MKLDKNKVAGYAADKCLQWNKHAQELFCQALKGCQEKKLLNALA